jgi:hypothetical protein
MSQYTNRCRLWPAAFSSITIMFACTQRTPEIETSDVIGTDDDSTAEASEPLATAADTCPHNVGGNIQDSGWWPMPSDTQVGQSYWWSFRSRGTGMVGQFDSTAPGDTIAHCSASDSSGCSSHPAFNHQVLVVAEPDIGGAYGHDPRRIFFLKEVPQQYWRPMPSTVPQSEAQYLVQFAPTLNGAKPYPFSVSLNGMSQLDGRPLNPCRPLAAPSQGWREFQIAQAPTQILRAGASVGSIFAQRRAGSFVRAAAELFVSRAGATGPFSVVTAGHPYGGFPMYNAYTRTSNPAVDVIDGSGSFDFVFMPNYAIDPTSTNPALRAPHATINGPLGSCVLTEGSQFCAVTGSVVNFSPRRGISNMSNDGNGYDTVAAQEAGGASPGGEMPYTEFVRTFQSPIDGRYYLYVGYSEGSAAGAANTGACEEWWFEYGKGPVIINKYRSAVFSTCLSHLAVTRGNVPGTNHPYYTRPLQALEAGRATAADQLLLSTGPLTNLPTSKGFQPAGFDVAQARCLSSAEVCAISPEP